MIGAARRPALSGAAVALAIAFALPLSISLSSTPAEATAPVAAAYPPLEALMISQPLPGYTMAPSGPTNGPLTPA